MGIGWFDPTQTKKTLSGFAFEGGIVPTTGGAISPNEIHFFLLIVLRMILDLLNLLSCQEFDGTYPLLKEGDEVASHPLPSKQREEIEGSIC